MSASSKKKLRSEAVSAKLTERQTAEQKEAKKLKIYTVTFAVVLALLVIIAAWVGISRGISSSGIREKKTIAATVGSHEISNAEINYYYIDAVNSFVNNYGNYAVLYGLDTTRPLNEQISNEETGATWADDFITSAVESARATYALVDAANAEGYAISEDDMGQVNSVMNNLELYAKMYGYDNADAYLKAMYGNGASKEGYLEYYRNNILAASYQSAHQDALTFSSDEIRTADAADPKAYDSFSYNQYYLSVNRFLPTKEDGAAEYTDAERDAALIEAEATAKGLTEGITSVEEMDTAIAALSINEGTSASSTAYDRIRYNAISSTMTDWVTDASRRAGDTTYIASTATNDDGSESVNGYYIGFFRERTDNTFPLVNVRHILITPQGGTVDADGNTIYTDDEMAAAKAEAEAVLTEWKSGAATEESFAALAAAKTADSGSSANGGLYENVYPGQMVQNFNDWCFDSSRTPGDTGIVESNYGFHVMFFVGNSDLTYRDSMIQEELTNTAMSDWYNGLVDAVTVTNGDTSYVRKDLVLSRGN